VVAAGSLSALGHGVCCSARHLAALHVFENLKIVGSSSLGPRAGQTGFSSPVPSTQWRPQGPPRKRNRIRSPNQTVGPKHHASWNRKWAVPSRRGIGAGHWRRTTERLALQQITNSRGRRSATAYWRCDRLLAIPTAAIAAESTAVKPRHACLLVCSNDRATHLEPGPSDKAA